MAESCIITISGDLGSGKSTVARTLCDELALRKFSTGDMQRALALEMGITSLELNKLAESDPAIDEKIDSSTRRIAQQEGRVLFDSRLAWHFVPESYKVFLTVDPKLGAERIYSAGRGQVEQYASLEEAIEKVRARRESENLRYAELYGVNPERLENYDLVVDTSHAGPGAVAGEIMRGLQARKDGISWPGVWLSPRTPFPTRDLTEDDKNNILAACSVLDHRSRGPVNPVLRVGRYFYIHGDHFFWSAFMHAPVIHPFVPAEAAFSGDDPLPEGLTTSEFVVREATPQRAHDWEEFNQFRYPSCPSHFSP